MQQQEGTCACSLITERKVSHWIHAANESCREAVVQMLKASSNAVSNAHSKVVAHVLAEIQTAFCCAASCGHHGLVAQLLATNPDLIHTVDKNGRTVLHLAAENGHEKTVALLLAANLDLVHTVDSNDMTPLFCAVASNRNEIVAQLLAASPSSVNRVDSKGRTALHVAATKRHSVIVGRLLAVSPQLVDLTDCEGKTALSYPTDVGILARLLIANYKNQGLKSFREPALHTAIRCGNAEEVAKLLAEHPDAINEIDSEGCTAVHVAAAMQDWSPEVMTLVLAAASPQLICAAAASNQGSTALHVAVHLEAVEQLLAASPSLLDAADKHGRTCLHYAAREGRVRIVSYLLATFPDLIERVDSFGLSAVHCAASAGSEVVLELLLAFKPELAHLVVNEGSTLLHFICGSWQAFSPRLVKHLLALNPNALHALDSEGRTPLAVAVRNAHAAVIEVLQMGVCFDELAEVFSEYQGQYEEQLRPVMERQCACLLALLNRDAVAIVQEYLGFSRQKKRKRSCCEEAGF